MWCLSRSRYLVTMYMCPVQCTAVLYRQCTCVSTDVMITCLVSRLWKPLRLCSQLAFGCHSDNPCVIASVLRHHVTIMAIMIPGDDEPKYLALNPWVSNSLKVFIFKQSEKRFGRCGPDKIVCWLHLCTTLSDVKCGPSSRHGDRVSQNLNVLKVRNGNLGGH